MNDTRRVNTKEERSRGDTGLRLCPGSWFAHVDGTGEVGCDWWRKEDLLSVSTEWYIPSTGVISVCLF